MHINKYICIYIHACFNILYNILLIFYIFIKCGYIINKYKLNFDDVMFELKIKELFKDYLNNNCL